MYVKTCYVSPLPGVPGSALAVPANEIVAHVWPQVSHWVA